MYICIHAFMDEADRSTESLMRRVNLDRAFNTGREKKTDRERTDRLIFRWVSRFAVLLNIRAAQNILPSLEKSRFFPYSHPSPPSTPARGAHNEKRGQRIISSLTCASNSMFLSHWKLILQILPQSRLAIIDTRARVQIARIEWIPRMRISKSDSDDRDTIANGF